MTKSGKKGYSEKLGLVALTAIVVSSMIGSGIDGLPQNMSAHSAVGPIIIAWLLTGFGMFFIARTFIILSNIRPDLQTGIYMYAREGFGEFIAFIVAWGYWLMIIFSNVAFAIMIMDSLNYFIPGEFTGGNNLASIIGASILIWGFNFIVSSGVKTASILNIVGTIAKLIPLFLFIVVVLYFFKSSQFLENFWGDSAVIVDQNLGSIYEQVIKPLDVAIWCFIGVESAAALSGRAKKGSDVGKATLLGFILAITLCILVSILPFGSMSQVVLSKIATPSTAGVMKDLVGEVGEVIINLGVLISILTSWLAWTMIRGEIPMVAAQNGTFPKVFAKTNKKEAPSVSLWVSSIIMQLIIILVYFAGNAWMFMLSISAITVLPVYFASSAYLLKLCVTGEYNQYAKKGRYFAFVTGLIGIVFCSFMFYANSLKYSSMVPVVLSLGIPLFIWARKQNSATGNMFTKNEKIVLWLLIGLDILAIYAYFFYFR